MEGDGGGRRVERTEKAGVRRWTVGRRMEFILLFKV